MRLENRAALITGGTSGIGEATCLLFGREGASVAVVGRNTERGKSVAKRISDAGGTAIFVQADVRKSDDCRTAVERTLETFGRLDVLFNNAGSYYVNDVVGCTEEEWDDQIDTSLKGTFLMSKYALPQMIERGSGSIINCASGWGLVGGPKSAAYCAAKGGMVVMTKAMAIDHGPQGIRVNAICPGDTDTPMEREDARNQGLAWDEYLEQTVAHRPIARMATPEEIAFGVLYLASDESSYVTGVALPVDGGGVAD
ncbi:MAG TPA: SDR family NAD(P)-dependent oxidoreductase [Actinomycetota bacterium]|jgi:NAD(P)-dependent dehydrogenase (short-subunit alcohol dehydrogenase family)|nr:SDR family NAD(P)-dependent oxidoreductase [Actinomycetota bacterium]